MIIKVMDKTDVMSWRGVLTRLEEAMEMAESLPKILEEGENFDDDMLCEIKTLRTVLDGVESEGLYPAYIPTNAL